MMRIEKLNHILILVCMETSMATSMVDKRERKGVHHTVDHQKEYQAKLLKLVQL